MIDRTVTIREEEGRVVETITYDNEAILRANAAQRAQFTGYKGNALVHAARLDMDDITRLRNLGYNLLSADPQEVRRALCYIQSNEQKFMTVEGKPFAMHRNKWQ